MHRYSIPSMTCGHCARTIDQAIKSVDPTAEVTVDLNAQEVSIRSKAAATQISRAIRSAGYEAVAMGQ